MRRRSVKVFIRPVYDRMISRERRRELQNEEASSAPEADTQTTPTTEHAHSLWFVVFAAARNRQTCFDYKVVVSI